MFGCVLSQLQPSEFLAKNVRFLKLYPILHPVQGPSLYVRI